MDVSTRSASCKAKKMVLILHNLLNKDSPHKKWLLVFKGMLLESYFVASHSTSLILIRPEKYMLSLQEECGSVGISNVRND